MTRGSIVQSGPTGSAVAALAVGLVATACGGGGGGRSSPTAPACSQLAGSWQYVWRMPPCGPTAEGAGSVVITQNECAVTVVIPGLGVFQGEIEVGRAPRNFTLAFDATAPDSAAVCSDSGAAGLQPFTETSALFLFGGGPTVDCCRHGSLQLDR